MPLPITIFIDADACPGEETRPIASPNATACHVYVVSKQSHPDPAEPWIERVIVSDGFVAADDWIAERAAGAPSSSTARRPVGEPLREGGGHGALAHGKAFTDSSVGMALATRNLMQELREAGAVTGRPPPFSAKDRSPSSAPWTGPWCAFAAPDRHGTVTVRPYGAVSLHERGRTLCEGGCDNFAAANSRDRARLRTRAL